MREKRLLKLFTLHCAITIFQCLSEFNFPIDRFLIKNQNNFSTFLTKKTLARCRLRHDTYRCLYLDLQLVLDISEFSHKYYAVN